MKQVQTPDSRKKEGVIWQRRFWEHPIRDSNKIDMYQMGCIQLNELMNLKITV